MHTSEAVRPAAMKTILQSVCLYAEAKQAVVWNKEMDAKP